MKKQLAYLGLIILTLADILFLMNITLFPVSGSFRFYVTVFDWCVCAILWAEFIYGYYHSTDKKRYLRENFITVFGMLPFDFTFFLRALRLLKLVQLIKILVLIRDTEESVARFLHKTYLDKIILLSIVFVFLITLSVKIIDADINSFHDALWYILVSMTSTGYGDVVPGSVQGRVIGGVAMICGILIFSLLNAVISAAYVSKLNKDNRLDLESKVSDLTLEVEKLNKKIDKLTENNDE